MSLLKADLDIAALYAELVTDRGWRRRPIERLRAEYERTRDAVCAITGHAELMDDEPVIQRSIQLRNPYVDPLNYIQVDDAAPAARVARAGRARGRSAARGHGHDDQRHRGRAEQHRMTTGKNLPGT